MARPYRPIRELEHHLDRGELDFAIAIAKGIARERHRPLELDVVVRFLPLIATRRPEEFDVWALRWLERWCKDLRGRASIDDGVEVVQALAAVPVEAEQAMRILRRLASPAAS
ncbi:MAG: hypothetical protein JWN81_3043 [Solirubrobacterales bacterium]|jgi:hypothetical protein|nr:hypothetical protein [Solirubrobacterales bacterium]